MNSYEYLEHHGIKGQKWGIRRFQNEDGSLTSEGRKRYGARDYQRQLNKLDEQVSEQVFRSERAGEKLKRLGEKAARDSASGKMTDKKAKKTVEKAKKLQEEYNEASRLMKEGESLTWKYIAEANQNGYTVNSKPVMRMVDKGTETLLGILGGGVATASYASVAMKSGNPQEYGFVKGNQFKVSKTKDGEKPDIRLTTWY